jgi:hypothetical protein
MGSLECDAVHLAHLVTTLLFPRFLSFLDKERVRFRLSFLHFIGLLQIDDVVVVIDDDDDDDDVFGGIHKQRTQQQIKRDV